MKKIVLHIGTEKTATTSLQYFFSANQARLNNYGIWYPSSENLDYCHRNAHFPLAASLYEECPDFVTPTKHFKPAAVFGSLFADFESRDETTLLISCEHFSSRCSRPERVSMLKNIFSEYELQIVVYLRPQHELVLSAYSTYLQAGGRDTLEEVARREWLRPQAIYFNYLKMIERWWGAFGKESVTVRIFQENQLYGGSVYRDFLSVLNIEWDDSLLVPENQNRPICKELADFLFLANQHFPNFTEDDRNGWELGQKFRAEVAQLFPRGTPLKSLFPKELKTYTKSFFSKYNKELALAARPDLGGSLFLDEDSPHESTDEHSYNFFCPEFVAWVVQQWKAGRPMLCKIRKAIL